MDALNRRLFPDLVRSLSRRRVWNVLFRTAHIAVTGILLGGHAFDVPEARLRTVLYACIATGLALIALEAYPGLRWVYQGRGVMVLSKLTLLCAVPFLWEYRLPMLLTVVVIASVGSHMTSRYRYYSFVHGRVLDPRGKS
jgi:hypothetical protein